VLFLRSGTLITPAGRKSAEIRNYFLQIYRKKPYICLRDFLFGLSYLQSKIGRQYEKIILLSELLQKTDKL
jgi:hypothetical protein